MKTLQIARALILAMCVLGVKAVSAEQPAPSVPSKATASKTMYTCPMHPQIRWTAPAECPLCGMKLSPVATKAAPVGSADQHKGMQMERNMEQMMGGCGMCKGMMECEMNMNHGSAPAASRTAPSRGYSPKGSSGGRGGCGC